MTWLEWRLPGEYGEVVILDSETTGLGSLDEPVQIAVVDGAGNVLFDSLIKPTIEIGAGAAAIHGITMAAVADAPTMIEAWDGLYTAIQGKLILAYGRDFDRGKISQGCRANHMPPLCPTCQWECVMEAYSRYYGRWQGGRYRWQKLTDACRQQGIPISNAHSVLGDALMTLELLRAMAGIREGVK